MMGKLAAKRQHALRYAIEAIEYAATQGHLDDDWPVVIEVLEGIIEALKIRMLIAQAIKEGGDTYDEVFEQWKARLWAALDDDEPSEVE